MAMKMRHGQSALQIKGRHRARERYWGFYDKEDHDCQACGRDRPLDVHHKDGDPLNNELVNLVGLCHFCHNRVHHYRRNDPVREQLIDEFPTDLDL